MANKTGKLLVLLVFLPASSLGLAQSQKTYDQMSLEELLNQSVSVSSARTQSFRESPGIITVITEEEIANSGARDLIDVLQMVPGFSFGTDVAGVVGLGVRGNWGHEGKVLLLVDDQEFNEPLYATLQFGNHFPLHSIRRIEIIRGPGSAVYGGYAELAVIRIITKTAEETNGARVLGTYGRMADVLGRRSLALSLGKQLKDFKFALHASGGTGNRSDQGYTDLFGNEYNLAGESRLDPMTANLAVGYKGLDVRFLVDRFSTTHRDAYDEIADAPVDGDFDSYFFETKYTGQIGPRLTITPRFRFKHQVPWHNVSTDASDTITYYDHEIDRYSGGLNLLYTASDQFTLTAGTELYRDEARLTDDTTDPWYFRGGAGSVNYRNAAFFSEGLFSTAAGNFTVGARISDHSQFGSSFVPRFGYTKVHGRFHVKALVSRAFREPSVENIDVNPLIKPERTTALEFEAGYQLSKRSFLSANIFDLTINKPIIYSYDPETDTESYYNAGQSGSRGFEVDYRFKHERGYAGFAYSYYNTAGKNDVDAYSVANRTNLLLGLPAHKLTAQFSANLGHNVHLTPSLVYLGNRWGYRYDPAQCDCEDPTGQLSKLDSVLLANIYLRAENVLQSGLEFGAGIFDLFNQKDYYVQPYNALHAPLPGPSREFVVRLGYRWGFGN